ncbi:YgdI/YgdR family lipoprotein [Pseudomonas xionganensis]|uniref:YgdI/YgdR family lipoprotein n=1 Tax=Pseudomonas xionganensis TaxID=2654845 RepID=A0A6I4KSY0_9PSED|nr:YgdI/YgdR family lipoprotein [Pseudomonas xionganensis]MVW75680.1 YgdI/YgdR family lipoprotein [Pseudomonas xionganensis]
MLQRPLLTTLLALSLATLAGCATPSVITLTDGREIQTQDLPQFDEESGFYQFEQIDGRRAKVNKDQVESIREL